ncbi:DNA mismatch repair endonuclease MutL [Brevibacillus laterosporus]|uniref:DNA mismatch repair endonuclease MutL n=1 Tax=Brevibacillus laterosporus TaxID=1465 RepID=UPI0018CEEBB4|nr:DNA mismatch repair endonuclease MutL [Brevibacillus laterosporus]MBG9800173.1 DNA mismatch repair protein MutL [Brevibacillus laterosporus]MCR8938281.1 DNA mismatch repair endonuclease MutL [Brevibacillus laterosporus]MCZ0840921.1 DNA mismatch repair endonuclease MutL [Brevibacillus laterosporus]MCZ0843529.1 DNA mismatch repair endonuclease MutL [Brevibacillus laterosporus]MED1909217.1 DNA mismatch repair endonuclease MutL [Brevibacillus laterosporus]
MGKIQVLTEQVSNMIAAGEVVERPASVVKELVENAIDAGTSQVEIHIEEGGLQLIRIVDNGAGMDRDDCLRAFERHATSKIRSARDLFHIRSLGFRGEALASIASVSRIELMSAEDSGQVGTKVVIDGGDMKSVEDFARVKGTEIVVRDLFFNTPARLKYMRSISTEVGHVSDYVNRLAITYPRIAFTLTHNGKTLLQTSGDGKLLHVMAAIYGVQVAKLLLPFEGETLDFRWSGLLSKTEVTRANRTYISTLVNGRYVRNYPLSQAIMRGYHTFLPIGRFPIVAMHIEMDPILVDVNVHPAKLEVRFSKEQELCAAVEQSVKEALQAGLRIVQPLQTSSKPKIKLEKPYQPQFNLGEHHSDEQQQQMNRLLTAFDVPLREKRSTYVERTVEPASFELTAKKIVEQQRDQEPLVEVPVQPDQQHESKWMYTGNNKTGYPSSISRQPVVEGSSNSSVQNDADNEIDSCELEKSSTEYDITDSRKSVKTQEVVWDDFIEDDKSITDEEDRNRLSSYIVERSETMGDMSNSTAEEHTENTSILTASNLDDSAHSDEDGTAVPVLYPVGQVHGTYIIAQNDSGMYLIDQHAAQERIFYEYFMQKLQEEKVSSQMLLFPHTVECTMQEEAKLLDRLELLQSFGLDIEWFGNRTFLVRAHPQWFPQGSEVEIINELIQFVQEASENERVEVSKMREKAAIMMSCKASIKANRYLTHAEMEALLNRLRQTTSPFTCPHGRPIAIHFSTYELEKMFKRVM